MAIRRAAVVMIAAVAVSCQTSPLVTDYGMTSNLSKTSSSAIYPNSTVPLKLEVKTASAGPIKVEYVSSSMQGTLLIDNQELRPGQFIDHDFSAPLFMSFLPSASGEAELKFRISNDLVTTEVSPLRFKVDEAAYQLQMISDTSVTVGIKESLSFAIRELQTATKAAGSKAPSNKFRITARISKGRGILLVKDQVLADNSAETKAAETKAAPSSVEVVKDEETPMYYTSMSTGENALSFDVSDEYDNTVTSTVKLKSGSPKADLRITLKQDSVYKAAVLHNFTLYPDTKGLNTKLTLSWAIGKNSTIQDISVIHKLQPVLAGNKVELACNYANPMGIITNSTGDLAVDFQIRDEYGSTYDTTLTLKIISPSVDFTFPDVAANLSEWKPYEWTGNLVAEAGTNAYQISYKNEEPAAGVLTINGAVPVDGDRTDLKAGKNVFKYTPKKVGVHNMTFVVYDKFGNEKSYPVKFTVGANKLGITVPQVPQVNYGQSVNVNVNIPAQEHIKSFKGVVSSLEGGTATIEVNGSKASENAEFALKTGTNVFKVTPTKVASEYAFKLLVRTDIGQEEAQEITVPIVLPVLSVGVTELVAECDLTGTLIYELPILEPHYTGSFTLTPSIVKGTDGTLAVGGKTVGNNQSAKIDKAGTVPVVFTPKSTGPVEVNIRVVDENSQEKVVSIKGSVTTPKLTATTSAIGATIRYKTETPFTLTINEALHPEAHSVIPTFVKGSGILKIEGQQVTPGVKLDLKNGTHNCAFIPGDCGEVDIQFKITDKHGEKTEAHALFTVEPYPLTFSIENISAATVNVAVPATFTVGIDEQAAPDAPYKISYTLESGQGTVKAGGAVLSEGTTKTLNKGDHAFSYTPSAAGPQKVIFTVEDMFGQKKALRLNIEAKNAPLNASASAGSLTTNLKKAVNFTVTASEADYTGQFPTTVINTGSGTLTASGSAVTFGKEFNISGGNTTMAYTPTTLGDHKLSFTVKDIYGQSKEFSVNIHADYAAMTATATGPGSMYVGRAATIALSLAEDNYTANFTSSYTGGTGVLKNGTTVWNTGTGYSIAGGSTNLNYTPTTTGSHQLNFTFTDSYGQTKQSSVTINVTQAPLTASATPNAATVYVGSAATSTLGISEPEHPGQFTVQPIISGSGTLTINGTNVGSSGTIRVNGGNSTIGYTPATTGTHSIVLNVTDAHGQSQATSFTVTAGQPEIEASVNSFDIYRNQSKEIALNITKPNYGGTYTVGVARTGSGSLTLGGSEVGGSMTAGSGVTRFTYTPSTTGNHSVTFTITSSDGKTKTVTASIRSSESPIDLRVSSEFAYVRASEAESGSTTDINVDLNRSYYTGNLKLELYDITGDIEYPQSNTLRILIRELPSFNYITEAYGWTNGLTGGGVNYTWKDAVSASGGKQIHKQLRIYGLYSPAAPSNAEKRLTLHFRATDDNGQTKTVTCRVTVEMP